ncbi:2-hydroxyacylsphingosine 1-beta-galactosyltransferase-like [Pomacea canaliculata]|uniref:2-hydroxyacylsphingosine 1-beta-galactosyltransferase-like n=1 Tax=Pomacea canaliculata TaxID=400727 RepID=UPI000D730BE5|nr:2-hydroxyacylsphingosine 1-beta-galactosyltransferase-like [Pomacea canaliculata]
MLVARAEIWLVTTEHILDYPRPSMPNVKLIGGTATGPGKPLPPQFKSFMDDAKEGVVIVSFGSYVLNPPEPITQKIMNVLKDLPFKSVFRSNISSPNSKKILTSSWIPQNDLLAHPNTRVFVSHCGNDGQYEALFHAVPVVCTPIFLDQFYNAERMRVKGMTKTVDLNTVSTHELHSTILKVATNTSYKQAITKASELFKIEFGVPVEKAAYWLDHVMKYGGRHLRSSGHEVSFLQFSCWDVYAFLLSCVLLILLIVVYLVYKAFKCFFSKSKPKIE